MTTRNCNRCASRPAIAQTFRQATWRYLCSQCIAMDSCPADYVPPDGGPVYNPPQSEAQIAVESEGRYRSYYEYATRLESERDKQAQTIIKLAQERDRLQEKLSQFEAIGFPTVDSVLGLAQRADDLEDQTYRLDNLLHLCRVAITTDPRDWSRDRTDVYLYAILVGWGEEIIKDIEKTKCRNWQGIRDAHKLRKEAGYKDDE